MTTTLRLGPQFAAAAAGGLVCFSAGALCVSVCVYTSAARQPASQPAAAPDHGGGGGERRRRRRTTARDGLACIHCTCLLQNLRLRRHVERGLKPGCRGVLRGGTACLFEGVRPGGRLLYATAASTSFVARTTSFH